MPHFKFPCQYVYWSQVDDHDNIKSNVLPMINNIASQLGDSNPFNRCRMVTNFSKPCQFLDDTMVQQIIWKNVNKMISEINCFCTKPTDFIVTNYWFNKYEKGHFQEAHTHFDIPRKIENKLFYPLFSAVYILHNEEEKNHTVFTVDDPIIPCQPMFDNVDFDTGNVDEIKEGTVLIFPITLKHFVPPVNLDGRITITFNISCAFEGKE